MINQNRFVRLFVGLFLGLIGTLDASAQQATSLKTSNNSNPLARLQQLSRRVQQKFTQSEKSPETAYRTQRADQQLYRAGHPANFQPTIQRASRIGSNGNHSGVSRSGFVQSPSPENQLRRSTDGWPDEPQIDDLPRQNTQQLGGPVNQNPIGNFSPQQPATSSNAPFQAAGMQPQRQPMYQNQQQPRYANGNQYQPYQTAAPYEDPGILGVNNSGNQPRFRHFSTRMPASERVVILEDELARREKELRAKIVENEILERRLNDNEQLLVEIQASIDEAIGQLTSAAETNQTLRERIVRLETEKVQQKATYDKLMDDVRGQLNELLKTEIAGK